MSDTFSESANAVPFTAPQIYRRSGKVSPASLAIAAAVLIPLGILGGFLYSAAVVYLPFIKLRGLVTFFFGAGLGAVAGGLCYNLKYRNGTMAALTVVGFAGIAYYSAWAIHRALVIGADQLEVDFVTFVIDGFDPLVIFSWMTYIYQEGIWEMGGNAALSGWGAAIVWMIEAGLIFGPAFVTGMATYGNRPFCENCHRWNDETEELAVLPVAASDPAWAQIRNGDFDALKKLQLVTEVNDSYVELRLADCPTCDESDYLSAIGIILTLDEGELKKNETDVFRNLSVSRDQRDEIVEFAAAMAEAVQEMQGDDEIPGSETDTPDDSDPDE